MVECVLRNLKNPRNACDLMVIFVISMTIMALLFTLHYSNVESLQDRKSLVIIDDILTAEEKPSITGSIFFHKIGVSLPPKLKFLSLLSLLKPEIWKYYSAELTPREGCAVESAALHNPNLSIFVLFVNQSNWMNNRMSPVLKTVLTYPNVHVRTINLRKYVKNTPLDSWLDIGQYQYKLIEKNAIEMLRFLSLWRWGGTYLDFNTIVLRDLSELDTNYLVANEKTNQLTTSILKLLPYGVGENFARNYLKSYFRLLDEEENRNGDYAEKILEKVVKESCRKNISEIVKEQYCFDMNLFGTEKFGDATFLLHQNGSYLSKLFRNTEQLYAIYNRHQFWNQTMFESTVNAPLNSLAMKHCPKVYRIANAK